VPRRVVCPFLKTFVLDHRVFFTFRPIGIFGAMGRQCQCDFGAILRGKSIARLENTFCPEATFLTARKKALRRWYSI
jgi:hypothetical protein